MCIEKRKYTKIYLYKNIFNLSNNNTKEIMI